MINMMILPLMKSKNKIKLKKLKRKLRYLDYRFKIKKYKRLIIILNE